MRQKMACVPRRVPEEIKSELKGELEAAAAAAAAPERAPCSGREIHVHLKTRDILGHLFGFSPFRSAAAHKLEVYMLVTHLLNEMDPAKTEAPSSATALELKESQLEPLSPSSENKPKSVTIQAPVRPMSLHSSINGEIRVAEASSFMDDVYSASRGLQVPRTPIAAAILKDPAVLKDLFLKTSGVVAEHEKQIRSLFRKLCEEDSKVTFGEPTRMAYSTFVRFILSSQNEPDEVPLFFNAMSRPLGGNVINVPPSARQIPSMTLSEDDFVLGIAVTDPWTPHEGLSGIVRLASIFSAYDTDGDGVLDVSDFLTMIRHIRRAKAESTAQRAVVKAGKMVAANISTSIENGITKFDFVRMVLDETLQGTENLLRLRKSPFREQADCVRGLSVAELELEVRGKDASPALPKAPLTREERRQRFKRRRSFKCENFTDDDLQILDMNVHDLGKGEGPSKKLKISDFALPRSATESMLGELPQNANQEVMDQEAPKVLTFLLNPKGDPNFCNWKEEESSPCIEMQEEEPRLVPDKSRLRKVLVVPEPNAKNFGNAIRYLADKCAKLCQEEERVLQLSSPVYVFGDLHGNMQDLAWLGEKLWPLGPVHTAGKFLFLGDYVDRGPNSLEVIAYLFSLKLMAPYKVYLLRGNHEHRAMNGRRTPDSLLSQCCRLLGLREGIVLWEAINNAFDTLPLAAIVDGHLFASHGGVPRKAMDKYSPMNNSAPSTDTNSAATKEKEDEQPVDDVLEAILCIPKVLRSTLNGAFDAMTTSDIQQQLARDLMWGDPATPEQVSLLDEDGFLSCEDPRLANEPRGGALRPRYLAFGMRALDFFNRQYQITHMLRGHSVKATGLGLQHGARVVTIFSDSMDHHVRGRCGWVLIEERQGVRHKVHLHVGGPTSDS